MLCFYLLDAHWHARVKAMTFREKTPFLSHLKGWNNGLPGQFSARKWLLDTWLQSCLGLTGFARACDAWAAWVRRSHGHISGLCQAAMVCLGHIAVNREVDWGQDEWATGVSRSLDRKVSLYPQEHLFKIALSPNILLVALGPSVLRFKIIWQLSFLQSEKGFWGYKIISELSQLAQPGGDYTHQLWYQGNFMQLIYKVSVFCLPVFLQGSHSLTGRRPQQMMPLGALLIAHGEAGWQVFTRSCVGSKERMTALPT